MAAGRHLGFTNTLIILHAFSFLAEIAATIPYCNYSKHFAVIGLDGRTVTNGHLG